MSDTSTIHIFSPWKIHAIRIVLLTTSWLSTVVLRCEIISIKNHRQEWESTYENSCKGNCGIENMSKTHFGWTCFVSSFVHKIHSFWSFTKHSTAMYKAAEPRRWAMNMNAANHHDLMGHIHCSGNKSAHLFFRVPAGTNDKTKGCAKPACL